MSTAFETLTLAELLESSKDQPIEYLVDGLFPVGSLNMLAGKPKSGKSTLVRQLAGCVAKGTEFLGRSTSKGEVLYFASEELGAHLSEHFQLLDIDQGVHTVLRRPGAGFVARLEATLKLNPEVKLVILDPLVNFLPGVDMDSYGEIAPALADLVEMAERCGIVILAVHHMKKKATEEAGDATLGSTAVMAAMCSSLFLTGEMGDVRKIRSSQRYGTRLEFTELAFDENTRAFSIGELVKTLREKRTGNIMEAHRSNVLRHINDNPDIDQSKLLELVGCSKPSLLGILAELTEQGRIMRDGKGARGSAYTYRAVLDPESWGTSEAAA
jgi:archaellum biogenesis ATPase FlaH